MRISMRCCVSTRRVRMPTTTWAPSTPASRHARRALAHFVSRRRPPGIRATPIRPEQPRAAPAGVRARCVSRGAGSLGSLVMATQAARHHALLPNRSRSPNSMARLRSRSGLRRSLLQNIAGAMTASVTRACDHCSRLLSPSRSRRGRCGSSRGGPALDAPDVEARLVELARSGAPLRRALAALAERSSPRARGIGSAMCGCATTRRAARPLRAPGAGSRARRSRAAPAARHRAAFVAADHVDEGAALVPVATPEDEERLAGGAQRLTARALAREVRAVDARSLEAGGVLETDEDGVEQVRARRSGCRVTPRVRARWSRARLLARRVAGEALSQARGRGDCRRGDVGDRRRRGSLALHAAPSFASCKTRPPFGHGSARENRSPTRAQRVSACKLVLTLRFPASAGLPHAAASRASNLPSGRARRAAAARAADRAAVARRDRPAAARGRAHAQLPVPRLSRIWPCSRASGSGCRRARRRRCCGSSEPARSRPSYAPRSQRPPFLGPSSRADSRARARAAEPWRAAWVAHAEAISVRRLEEDVERRS